MWLQHPEISRAASKFTGSLNALRACLTKKENKGHVFSNRWAKLLTIRDFVLIPVSTHTYTPVILFETGKYFTKYKTLLVISAHHILLPSLCTITYFSRLPRLLTHEHISSTHGPQNFPPFAVAGKPTGRLAANDSHEWRPQPAWVPYMQDTKKKVRRAEGLLQRRFLRHLLEIEH